jgi:hypothetical protein
MTSKGMLFGVRVKRSGEVEACNVNVAEIGAINVNEA